MYWPIYFNADLADGFAKRNHFFGIYIITFACNTKSFVIVVIFFFFFFSTVNLDGLTKLACQIFYIC